MLKTLPQRNVWGKAPEVVNPYNCDSTAGVLGGVFNGCSHCKNVGDNVSPMPTQPKLPCDHNFYDN
jgi:hypothetical protein